MEEGVRKKNKTKQKIEEENRLIDYLPVSFSGTFCFLILKLSI